MKDDKNSRPVGIFDSGLGGLCSLRGILEILPGEDIIYFGDSGRVPYGSRSYETIIKYSIQDIKFLQSKNVKMILISCGTVSSVAIDHLKEAFCEIPIIGVVEAACEKAVAKAKQTNNKKIGVIATEATISRGAYKKHIKAIDKNCEVYEKACPLFVPLVEYGHTGDDGITKMAAEKYLREFKDLGLSSLVLGCTHYPMIKNIIRGVIGDGVELIDVGLEAAYGLKRELGERGLLNGSEKKGVPYIYVSDEPLNFSRTASNFLGFDVKGGVMRVDIEKY